MARCLGLDYGTRRVGVALSDELGLLALPLEVWPAGESAEVVRKVTQLCCERQVGTIVVGLPLNMDGSRGPAAEAAERFAEALRQAGDRPVVLWDERLSSRQVERMLVDADVSRRRRRQVTDKLAAQLILQSYLDAHADPIAPPE